MGLEKLTAWNVKISFLYAPCCMTTTSDEIGPLMKDAWNDAEAVGISQFLTFEGRPISTVLRLTLPAPTALALNGAPLS
ncbi:hypothetical protein CSKR_203905 [Clonorchis sinensis]|uniref:Uncharacterized protein n=1 Tax=Clonorchis sinensis TaxID=79923 RepID=A0A8T1N5G2_CLOSI|nr:hypothetical protein CSKR_203905 [Clonorchis sinensis]